MIESLLVSDFRSHNDSKVDFCPGLNIFLGEVGAGKTSILEAVSFALFGKYSSGLSQSELIRRGRKEAKIILIFSIDSRKYKVERNISLRKTQRAKLWIFENNEWQIAVEGTSSVSKSIEEIMRIEASTFLAAIYASQGEIKEMLQTQAGKRREQFDKLLGIDVYERLWTTMGDTRSLVLKDITEVQEKASGFEVLKDQRKTLTEELDEARSKISLAINFLKEIDERLHPERMQLKTLNELKEELDRVQTSLVKVETETKKTLTTIDSLNRKMRSAKDAEKIFLQNSKYIKLEGDLKKEKERIDKILQRKDNLKCMLERENHSLEQKTKRKNELDEQLANLPELEKQLEDYTDKKQKLSELRKNKKEIMQSLEKAKNEYIRISQKIETEDLKVNRVDKLGECPTCLQEVPDNHKTKVKLVTLKTLENLKEQVTIWENSKANSQKELDSLEVQLNSAVEAETNLKVVSVKINTLKQNKVELERIQQDLSQINDQVGKLTNDLSQLTETAKNLSELDLKLKYTIEKAKTARDAELRIASKQDLATLLLQEQTDLQSLQDESKSLNSSKQEIEAQYDSNEHNIVKDNIENLRIDQAKTSDRISNLKASIKKFESKLKEVSLGIKGKEDARKKALSLKAELKMIDLLRSGLREIVQPAVRKNSVSLVSEAFQGFYQALSNDNIDYAAIDEDGNIDVTRNGEPSPINSLSGGETTCAALALRLAICSSLTQNQLLLLDEPTIHLDEVYRAKLRDFLGTHDFDQLIVVTHDNTFDSLPAQIYNVTRKKGESIVTALRTAGGD